MSKIFLPPRLRRDNYGKPIITSMSPEDFKHLLGVNLNNIIPFEDGTEELIESGVIILPRKYYIFIGTKDNELQFKPYESDQYRIVVSTISNIIQSIDSIG